MLFLILSLAASVLAGTPLHKPDDGMMECCKRARGKEQSPMAEAARLCCAVDCSTTAPTSSGAAFNPAPANFVVTKSIADQIARLFSKEKAVPVTGFAYSPEILPRTFQPSYIQHHAFLI